MEFLVKKAQKGDADAFVTLIEQSKRSMYKVAKGFFMNEEDVADAIADSVLAAYEHIQSLKNPGYFKTWLIRILINNCNMCIRERKRCDVIEYFPEINYIDRELEFVEFQEMLNSFTEDCRIILLLYYGEQFTVKEISQILDLNENTIRSKLRRTRDRLRKTIVESL